MVKHRSQRHHWSHDTLASTLLVAILLAFALEDLYQGARRLWAKPAPEQPSPLATKCMSQLDCMWLPQIECVGSPECRPYNTPCSSKADCDGGWACDPFEQRCRPECGADKPPCEQGASCAAVGDGHMLCMPG